MSLYAQQKLKHCYYEKNVNVCKDILIYYGKRLQQKEYACGKIVRSYTYMKSLYIYVLQNIFIIYNMKEKIQEFF